MPQVVVGGPGTTADERIGSVHDGSVRYFPASVAGGPQVTVCADPDAGDAVAAWFLEHGHDTIDEPVQRAFVGAVRAGDQVLDLGSHLGLFSLTAAAIGASVLSVDANVEHARWLSLAADRNGFERVHVAHAAIAGSDDVRSVSFVPRSIHGHVLADGATDPASVTVQAATVDALVADLGWDHLDVVKMDIEGSEIAALDGMSKLFDSGCRPVLVLECNASMLGLLGWSVTALRSRLCDLGYELHLIDHLRPGVLVPAGPLDVQPESASDLIATTPSDRDRISTSWRIDAPFSRSRLVSRILDAATSPAAGYRRHSAELLEDGPAWLRDHAVAAPARRALALDLDPDVRTAGRGPGRSAGVDLSDAPAPPPGDLDDDVLVWAEDVVVRRRVRDPGRRRIEVPAELARHDDHVLRGVSMHLERRDSLAVLCRDRTEGEHLLGLLAGDDLVVSGRFDRRGTVASLLRASEALDRHLDVADNAALLGAFLGANVSSVLARLDELLGECEIGHLADAPLHSLSAAQVTALVLDVAFCSVGSEIVLLGELPSLPDGAVKDRLRARCDELWARGSTLVQVVADPAALLIRPNRAAWVEDGTLRCVGHAPSVFEAAALQQIGFRPAGRGWDET